VTFNQWGREFPMDGMNEAGLVVALMWLDETQYPVDERPSLRELEWIQYQLDNFGSVAEVLERASDLRIRGTPLHYLVADASGAVVTMEWLEGRLVAHLGPSLPTANLTNDSYDRSMSYLRQFSGFGGNRNMPSSSSSLDRFARTAMLMRRVTDREALVDQAFDILQNVAQPNWTRWSIVYDAPRREISWVSEQNRDRKTVRFDQLDFSCSADGKMLSVHSALEGDVSARLDDYSPAVNFELVKTSFATTSFTRDSPASYAERDAAHAESFACAGGRRRAVRP
jgi:choloylglycine hydrolase